MNTPRIERYVAGRMSEAEAEAFEDSCVEDPQLARQVEFEQRLKTGMGLVVASGSTAEFVRSSNDSRWPWALAASLLIAIAAVFVWQRMPGPQGALLAAAGADQPRHGSYLRLAGLRGQENTPQLPRGVVRVEIIGLFDPGFLYSVALDRVIAGEGTVTMARLDGQHPVSPVSLQVFIDGGQLEAGSYSLHVSKQGTDEEALDFAFSTR